MRTLRRRIAKSMKQVFGRILVSKDVHDSLRLIAKYNGDPEIAGVDLV
jgi:hypothetical protein